MTSIAGFNLPDLPNPFAAEPEQPEVAQAPDSADNTQIASSEIAAQNTEPANARTEQEQVAGNNDARPQTETKREVTELPEKNFAINNSLFSDSATAKAAAQSEIAQHINTEILKAASKDVGNNAEFRDNAKSLSSEIAKTTCDKISEKLPANTPPQYLYETLKAAGSSVNQTSAPALVKTIQMIGESRAEANKVLVGEGYDAKALANLSTTPAAKAATTAVVDKTSLANPNITSNADPKTIIADVSGKDNSSADIPVVKAYSQQYDQGIRAGLSPTEANKKGWDSVLDTIIPLRTGSPVVVYENKDFSVKTDGKAPKSDIAEIRLSVPLFRVPAANANWGARYTNNDTNVINTASPMGKALHDAANFQRTNPGLARAGVTLGAAGALIPAAEFGGSKLAKELAPIVTTSTAGFIAMGPSDAGRYDVGRANLTVLNTEIRVGANNDKGGFAKIQMEHAVEGQLFSSQATRNDGWTSNFAPVFVKGAWKHELGANTMEGLKNDPMGKGEFSMGSKMDTNFGWAGNIHQDTSQPNAISTAQEGANDLAGPTKYSVGLNGTTYNLNDPKQMTAWRNQFPAGLPIQLQSMRGSDKDAAGSQLVVTNPRTNLNLGDKNAVYQTSDQGSSRPQLGTRLDSDYVKSVDASSKGANPNFGDQARSFVNWVLHAGGDGRTNNEKNVELSRENAGLQAGLKPIESTVAELNYTGAIYPVRMSALASVTKEQLIALNPDKVVETTRTVDGKQENVKAFKEGERLILPVATSKTGHLVMLNRATASSGNAVDVPKGQTGTTHVEQTPEDFYRDQIDFTNGYNKAVSAVLARNGGVKANDKVTDAELAKLNAFLVTAQRESHGLIHTTETAAGHTGDEKGPKVYIATVELGNKNNPESSLSLGDPKRAEWISQQLLKKL